MLIQHINVYDVIKRNYNVVGKAFQYTLILLYDPELDSHLTIVRPKDAICAVETVADNQWSV